ncbi:MAG: 50S ribosomal protein L32 [bacterium]|nr:50S ribosomal protein L32 [bacterium]
MTPLPKKKLSRLRQGRRRAGIKLQEISLTKCPNCGADRLPHSACPNCGMYRGRLVTIPETKTKVRRVSGE